MKKLLKERFQELAGIKPLYTEQRGQTQLKNVTWEEYKDILKKRYGVYNVEDGNQLVVDAGMANELERFKDIPAGPIDVKRIPIGWFIIVGVAVGLRWAFGGGGGSPYYGGGPGSGMGGTWPPEPSIW